MTLPQGWAETTIGECSAAIQYGLTCTSSPQGSGYRYIRITDIQDQRIDWPNVPYAQVDEAKASESQVAPGDLLFARTGATVGKSYLVEDVPDRAAFASYLIRVRTDPDGLLPKFAAWFFRSPGYWEQIYDGAEGTGQPNFNGTKLAALEIPLPPLAEQGRIVAKLDALSARLANARDELARVPPLAQRIRQQALTSALQGRLTASKSEGWSNLERDQLSDRRRAYLTQRRGSRLRADIPERIDFLRDERSDWLDCRLADVISLRLGFAFKSADFVKTGGTPLLRGANVAPGNVDWTDKAALRPGLEETFAAYRLYEGDIVIAMDRPVISSGLKIARLKKTDAGCLLVQRVANPQPSQWILPDFLMAVLCSDLFMQQIADHSTGSDLPHISGNDILTTPCPLPPLSIQKRIADHISTTFARADRLEAEAARAVHLLDRLEAAILAKAFRGELVPQDPTDEPASALLARIRHSREEAAKPKLRRQPKLVEKNAVARSHTKARA